MDEPGVANAMAALADALSEAFAEREQVDHSDVGKISGEIFDHLEQFVRDEEESREAEYDGRADEPLDDVSDRELGAYAWENEEGGNGAMASPEVFHPRGNMHPHAR